MSHQPTEAKQARDGESWRDQRERLALMAENADGDWDLSDNDRAAIRAALAHLDDWKRLSVIEIAVDNPSVSDYMTHWEGRALKAEAAYSISIAAHAAATARIAALEAENERLKCRDAERQVDDYRSGYSAGWSDGKSGTPMRDRECAALFFGQRVSADETPCPVCGCEERGQGGYLQCECPAVSSSDSTLSSTAGGQ